MKKSRDYKILLFFKKIFSCANFQGSDSLCGGVHGVLLTSLALTTLRVCLAAASWKITILHDTAADKSSSMFYVSSRCAAVEESYVISFSTCWAAHYVCRLTADECVHRVHHLQVKIAIFCSVSNRLIWSKEMRLTLSRMSSFRALVSMGKNVPASVQTVNESQLPTTRCIYMLTNYNQSVQRNLAYVQYNHALFSFQHCQGGSRWLWHHHKGKLQCNWYICPKVLQFYNFDLHEIINCESLVFWFLND